MELFFFSAGFSFPDDHDASRPAQSAGDAVLYVSGEVDLLTAPVLRSRLREAASGGRGVVVDLSAVTFIDCAGLTPLMEARRDLGTRLALRGLPDPLLTMLRVCHLESAFTVLDAADTPIEALRGVGDEPGDRRTTLNLQEAMTNAMVVEQAKGLLMGALGCDADDAWQLMLDVCRAYRVRVGDLATVLVRDADGTFTGIADPPLMHALRAVLPPAYDARAQVSQ